MSQANSVTLEGEEKELYLKSLDIALDAISNNFRSETPRDQLSFIKRYGDEKKWDWDRMRPLDDSYKNLASMIDEVRAQFAWFSWIYTDEPSQNRGYFKKIGVRTDTGLPLFYDFMNLEKLKVDADKNLGELPTEKACLAELERIIMTDHCKKKDIGNEIGKIHDIMMKRSFIEKLKDSELIGWRTSDYKVTAKRIIPLGIEELWNINVISYSAGFGLFHIYDIDLWQDISDPVIKEMHEGIYIAPTFKNMLSFSDSNSAWYILSDIDQSFESLHPVHASRAVIGPMVHSHAPIREHDRRIAILDQLAKADPQASFLRATVQYSFAPNQTIEEETVRQVIHQRDWEDEILVVPPRHAQKVSSSLLGERIRILER